MQEKYAKLFYEFEPQETKWGDWCHSPQAYFRGESAIPGSKLNVGFQVFKAPVFLNKEPHFHREDEYLVFLGAKLPDVFDSWDAEVHFHMGKTLDTMEKVVITDPTIIKVPGGWWHGPLNFVRVDKPMMFQAALLAGNLGSVKYIERKDGERQYVYSGDETSVCVVDPKKKCEYCGYCFSHPEVLPERLYSFVKWNVINEDGVKSYSDTGSYDPNKAPIGPEYVLYPGAKSKPYSDATVLKAPKPPLSPEVTKCVLACPKEETGWGAWCPSPQTYFRGEIYMEEATYHIGYQLYAEANDAEISHFHAGIEEYIFIMGQDPMNMFDFDCEIEFLMGDDPEHMESRLISKPTVIRVPPNVWHCPIKFRRMRKPVLFQAAYLSGTWSVISRGPDKTPDQMKSPHDRKENYNYMGDNVRMCRLEPNKRCWICGRCAKKPEEYLTEEELKK